MGLRHLSEGQERVLAGVAGLLIPAQPRLDEAAHDRVSRYVTRFVALQVENIPAYLRTPYLVAVTGFQLLPLLRYGRPFTALPVEAQRAYLSLWTDGPLGVTRDFVKLIRGCALLAYFDHPEVRAALQSERVAAGSGQQRRLRVVAR